jgi:hypothetical protein
MCVCRHFLVYLLPCLLARLFVFFCFKLTLLRSNSPLFTQNTPYGVTIKTGSNLSKYISKDNLILAHINNTKARSAFSQKNEIKNWKIEKEVILKGKLVNSNTIVKFGSHKVSIFLKNLDSWVNNFIVKVIPLVTNLLGFFLCIKVKIYVAVVEAFKRSSKRKDRMKLSLPPKLMVFSVSSLVECYCTFL